MNLVFEPSDRAAYLAGLNECFPGWGGDEMYAWCFARTATGPAPERMVFAADDGAWVAGSAISYRTIHGNGARRLVGVMTGSWTLPAARGKGLFPRFIQETRKRVADHRGVAVLAFLGDVERASTRKLLDAGSRAVPSTSAIGEVAAASRDARDRELASRLAVRAATTDDAPLLHARFVARHERAAGFVYDVAAFAGQFILRVPRVEHVEGFGGAVALLEHGPDTDRVLFLDEGDAARSDVLRALHVRAADSGRKLFAYGVGDDAARVFAAAGLACKPGFVTVLAPDDTAESASICDELAHMDWDIQSGDRI